MNNIIKYLLFPIILSSSSINAMINNNDCTKFNKYFIKELSSIVVESVNINEKTKLPQNNGYGGRFVIRRNQCTTLTDKKLLIGEKNNDDNFKLQHYARLDIQKTAKLTMFKNCRLRIQKDGKLNNRGILELQDGSTLIAPPIDIEKYLIQNSNGSNSYRLKHGIDNKDGIITVDKTSKIYWQETYNDEKKPCTICKGTIDFSKLFEKPGEYPSKDNFIMNLEGVTVKLFNPNSTTITDNELRNIDTFRNITLCNGCILDLNYELKCNLYKDILKQSFKNSDSINVLKNTISKEFNKDLLTKLFKNGKKLKISLKYFDGEKIIWIE